MSYDLALGRLGHDLVWQAAPLRRPATDPARVAIWPIEGADRVAQQVKITLLAFLGEWFLDNRFGVPYLEEILIKNPRLSSVESILRKHIISVPDVQRITSLTMNFDRRARSLSVDFTATTALGPIRDTIKLDVALRRAA